MKYKTIKLTGNNSQQLNTEAAFEIAVAKADGAELVRFDIQDSPDETGYSTRKKVSALEKIMRSMKESRKIQFYATNESFTKSSTEAVFLINKYPDVFENIPDNSSEYIYIKL